MPGRLLLAALAAAALSACAANKMDVLKQRAADVFGCSKDNVTLSQIANENTQSVSGCGKQALFAAAPSGGWVQVGDLRERAAVDMGCPPGQLTLTPTGAGPTMSVEGCLKRATYVYTVKSSTKYNSVFDWVMSGGVTR
jgi:hypothetical protein